MNKNTAAHFSWKTDLFKRMVMVLTLCAFVFSAFGIHPVAASAPASAGNSASNSVSGFAACIVRDLKIMPQAKKLSPQGYQDFERALNGAINATGPWSLFNPYVAAVRTGATYARFFGYNLVWYIGAVQDCWTFLWR
jgi:hypothetical protein